MTMKSDQIIEEVQEQFKTKLNVLFDQFEADSLNSGLFQKVETQLQSILSEVGCSVMTRVFEEADCQEATLERNGNLYRNKGQSAKDYLTLFGKLSVRRNLFQMDTGGPSYIPLEDKLGLVDCYATAPVEESILFCSAHLNSYEIEELFSRFSMFKPSRTAIVHLIDKAQEVILASHEDLMQEQLQTVQVPRGTDVFVAGMDGANVPLREQGSKKGRPALSPKQMSDSSEQSTCWKNAMVGSFCFYEINKKHKELEDGQIIDFPGADRLSSDYVSHMPEDNAPGFKADFSHQLDVIENLLEDCTVKILLMDGGRNLWNYVDHQTRFDDYEKLLDYWHATEHLSNAAAAIFGKGTTDSKNYYQRWQEKLKHEEGSVAQLLKSLRRYRKTMRTSERAKSLSTEITFFTRNKHRMNYPQHIQEGWPIGSGPTEAACKTLVKSRMCRSGMRWSRNGGEVILQLRTKVKAKRWDSFWQSYHQVKLEKAA